MTAPTDILVTPQLLSVDENSANGTVLGTFTVVDIDMTSYTWSLVDDAAGRFAMSGTSLIVANGALLDYERQAAYIIIVRVTEGGLTRDEEFTVTLLDVQGEIVNGSTGVDVILGDLGNDSLVGGAGNDSLAGGAGNDNLSGNAGADTMSGGAGNDTFYLDNVLDQAIDEAFFGGTDLVISTVAYTLSASVENLTLLGTAVTAVGNTLANVLIGNTGGNVLNGLSGMDTMAGGAGDDTYYVDNANDVVQELLNEGIDTVISTVSYNLTVSGSTAPREVERLTLAAGLTNINATGNGLNNTLTGNDGNNVLNGMAGNDTMVGGLGNDTYYIDSSLDVITEASVTGGIDTVISKSTYSIAAIANVENLTLIGTSAVNATGNALANTIIGNSAANLIDGGAGNDTMTGGQGNDTFVLSAATDVVTEGMNAGIDTVRIAATYSIASVNNVERIELTGSDNFNATGNTLNNQLVGNSGANTLDGGTGVDTMAGGGGNDTYMVDSTFEVVTEGALAGIDTVISKASYVLGLNIENLTLSGTATVGIANTLANVVVGNTSANSIEAGAGNDTVDGGSGNDTISGGAGLDSLTGGLGADWFYFDTAPNGLTNVDTITDFVAGSDTIRLAQSIFGAAGSVGALGASTFVLGTAATTSSSRIIYDATTGNVLWDSDGTGANAAVKLAVIANKAALTAKDFAIALSAPTAVLANDSGLSASDRITNNGTVNVTGLVSGGTWQYSVNGGMSWSAGIGTSVTLTGDGLKSIFVRQTDSSGNVSVRSAPLNFTIDTLAPSEVVNSLALSSDTGTSATDFITRTAAQTITGTLSAALAPGDTVRISIDNGATWQTATAAVGTNTFSLAGVTLSGSNTILARVEDSTGHVNSTIAQPFTVDTTIPTPTVSTVMFSDDTGRSATDFITSASTQTITGTLGSALGAGDIVRISMDNGGTWQTATTIEGGTTYTLNGVVLAGSGTMIVRVEDAAGNTGASRSTNYTLDLIAPAERVTTLAFSADTGVSATDFITTTNLQTVSGTLNAALQAGNIVRISMDNGATWSTANATTGGTSFSLSGVALELGTHVMVARVEDAAGNASISRLQSYTLTPPAPSEFVASIVFSADTGSSPHDFITMTAAQTITGALSAPLLSGDVVKVSIDNGVTWQTATSVPGSTSFTLTGVTLTGSSTVIARVEDTEGRSSAARLAAYTLDTTPPTADPLSVRFTDDTGISSTDLITKVASQTIWGTLAAPLGSSDTVKVSLDAGATWQTAMGAWGSSTYSLAGVTLSGFNVLMVRVEDTAGNFSSVLSQSYTLDTSAPVERVTSVAFSSDTGQSASDFITNVNTQTITGTLSGPLAAGNLVRVSLDNGVTWQTAAAIVGSTTFSLTGATLGGTGTMVVRVEDQAGNTSTALSQAYTFDSTVSVPVATLASDTGASASDKLTKTGTVNVSGLEPGATWAYSLDNGTTWTAGSGTSVTLTGDGAKSVIVRQTDLAGNTSLPSTPVDFTIDTVAAIPALSLAADTGVSSTDRITSNGTVNVSGLEVGSTWQYSTNGGVGWTAGSGTSFTLTGDGAKSVIVRQTDAAGNGSASSASFDFTIDTGAATPTLSLVADSGSSNADKITNSGTVSVGGLEAGGTWEYSTNNGASWTAGSGSSFALSGDGAKSVIVRQTDSSGNVSPTTTPLTFTLDTSAAAPSLSLASDTGGSASDKITKTGVVNVTGLESGAAWQYSTNGGASWTAGSGSSFTLTGDGAKSVIVKQTDTAGNVSANSVSLDFTLDTATTAPTLSLASDTGSSAADKITSNSTVNVSGLEAGAAWEYSLNSGTTWIAGSGSSFTLSGDGAKSVIVRQTDAAGNLSSSSAPLAFTLDTTVAMPVLSLASDTGSSSSDKITSSGLVNVAGLEAGAIWQYSTNGGASWTAGSGSTFTLTGDGTKAVLVQQTDVAGNTQTTAAFGFTLDTLAPVEVVSSAALSADNGVSSTDFITNVAAQTITGTLSAPLAAGSIVRLSLDNGATWQTATATTGSSTYSLAATLPASGVMVVRVEDAAGNFSTALTQAYSVVAAPAQPSVALASDTGSSAADKITASGAVSVSGLVAGATWEYSTTGGASWSAGSGTSVTLSGDGVYNLIVRQTDTAGNTSGNSSTLSFTLDTAAPTAPMLALAADTGSSGTDFTTKNGVVNVSGLEAGATWQYSLDSGIS